MPREQRKVRLDSTLLRSKLGALIRRSAHCIACLGRPSLQRFSAPFCGCCDLVNQKPSASASICCSIDAVYGVQIKH